MTMASSPAAPALPPPSSSFRAKVMSKLPSSPKKKYNGVVRSAEMTSIPVPQPSSSWFSGTRYMYSLAGLGIVYLVVTLLGSWRFLLASTESLSNDFFWVNYNESGAGYYVTRSFNFMTRVPTNQSDSIEEISLSDPLFVTDQDLTAPGFSMRFPATAARLVQYHRLTSITDGIKGIRQAKAATAMGLFTQYCWVDFERKYSLAHTPERAERCLRDPKYRANGAMYLESIFRNVDWKELMVLYSDYFTTSMIDPIRQYEEQIKSPTHFFDIMGNHTMLSIEDEAAYWKSHGITLYQLQFQNAKQIGIIDKIQIVNALGMTSTWTIKQLDYVTRTVSQTTYRMFWGPINDFWATIKGNTKIGTRSLVRETTAYYGKPAPEAYDFEQIVMADGVINTPLSIQDQLFRHHVGPFGSIDAFWTMYPSELFTIVRRVTQLVHQAVLSDEQAMSAFLNIPDGSVSIHPWALEQNRPSNWSFIGGSPLCSEMTKVTYVTQPFRFDSTCGNTVLQESIALNRYSAVLSLLTTISPDPQVAGLWPDDQALAQIQAICNTGTVRPTPCINALNKTNVFVKQVLTNHDDRQAIYELGQAIQKQIAAMNITLMQYGTRPRMNATTGQEEEETRLLTQSLLSIDNSGWHPLFGWLYLNEWVRGNREVVAFEGDHGSLVLISGTTPTVTLPPSKAEIMNSMSLYFQRGVQYVTLVFLMIALMALFYSITNRGKVCGWNLLDFNRVCGTVWAGRPLLFLRGMVAICILSTGRLFLTYQYRATGNRQLMIMEETPQNAFNTILNAGEAVWLVYVANDILMLFSQGLTYRYAKLCSFTVWLTVAILQLIAPIQHSADFSPQCEYAAPDLQVVCMSGTIYIGSPMRSLIIVLIGLASLVICYVIASIFCQPRELRAGCKLLLPGIAQEVFSSRGWMHENEWYLDPASAAIAGLITIRIWGFSRVLDVKNWSFLRFQDDTNTSAAAPTTKEMTTTSPLPEHLQHALHLAAITKKYN